MMHADHQPIKRLPYAQGLHPQIGELPLDVQVKFLRVLQEREIEPIGGKKLPINVRIVAATNRELEEEMAHGRFRMDLYYRLNVFPLSLPALRHSKDDILPLEYHFLRYYSNKEKKPITDLTASVADAMLSYSWPGNVRELENVIARSVLLTDGTISRVETGISAYSSHKTVRDSLPSYGFSSSNIRE